MLLPGLSFDYHCSQATRCDEESLQGVTDALEMRRKAIGSPRTTHLGVSERFGNESRPDPHNGRVPRFAGSSICLSSSISS